MGERVTVTARAWLIGRGVADRPGDKSGYAMASVDESGWMVWTDDDINGSAEPYARGSETGQQGRDAADAALRAAGVVLL